MSKEYTYRWDEEHGVFWAGERSYPASWHEHTFDSGDPSHPLRMETRSARVHFENQWQLSTIWGDCTYSDNYNGPWTHRDFDPSVPRPLRREMESPKFIEEPRSVEVGIMAPVTFTRPAQTLELPYGGKVEMPETQFNLWGDPLGYVTVPEYHRVADIVMHLPFDIDLPEGEWYDAQGFIDFIVTAGMERAM